MPRIGTKIADTQGLDIVRGWIASLPEAHAAIETWLTENALQSAGDPWEVYLTDPGEVPDPAEWQTEVIRPINK